MAAKNTDLERCNDREYMGPFGKRSHGLVRGALVLCLTHPDILQHLHFASYIVPVHHS